jgi:hypothetical protein
LPRAVAGVKIGAIEGACMRTQSRRTWPAFALVAIGAIVGLFVLNGVAAGVVLFVDFLGFIFACIYALAGEKPNDGVGGIGGPFGHM